MYSSYMGLQIRTCGKSHTAHITRKGSLFLMNSFNVFFQGRVVNYSFWAQRTFDCFQYCSGWFFPFMNYCNMIFKRDFALVEKSQILQLCRIFSCTILICVVSVERDMKLFAQNGQGEGVIVSFSWTNLIC